MTEVDGGTGEALPRVSYSPARERGQGPHGPSQGRGSQSRGGRIRRRIHKRVDGGDTDTPRHTVDNGRPVMVPEPDASNPEVDQELEDG